MHGITVEGREDIYYSGFDFLSEWVDPGDNWQFGWLRRSSFETVYVNQEHDVEDVSALLEERVCRAAMHARWGYESDVRVAWRALYHRQKRW